ncbi:MAG: choloylglycine hydrolase family protein [Agathobaculum sp.]|jgi:penicillin V acylase-like amidase (Ntn superfamily)|uniref:choloylglycine hydrolase family protein n=1 Tax=Agathobaculum sp. TaxID=2048138 RepID=UPI003D8E5905
MTFGCSSFSWQTKDGRHLLGRTYDQFGDLKANRVISVPRGAACAPCLHPEAQAPAGRYGYTGMAVLGYGEPILVDGVNEAGLMGALLHYPGYAAYENAPTEGRTAVYPGRLLAWLLGQCAGLEEAVEQLQAITLIDDQPLGSPLPAHYILSDKSGEALIIEPDEGGLRLHRNTVGVLTNSPDYLWHRTNLRNYVGVTNLPKAAQVVGGYEIREFGERLGGGFGLPGDYSSPSRFIRTAFVKTFAVEGADELDGVTRMFRAFAPVDIPEGLARADPDYEAYEQTLCTAVMCAESGVYYFAPAQNRRISAVRLPSAEQGTDIRYFALGEAQDVDYRN